MTGDPEPIGAEARRALEKELARLRTERDTVAATLAGADNTGDAADQADELQRADTLQQLDNRIRNLDVRLRQAADAGPPSETVIGVGTTVTVRFGDGVEQTVHIGEVADALDQNLVTADSPLGRALLGHHAGDEVAYDAPDGHTTARIVSLG
nr:GreA/GreB family elongation factor [Streptomyces sp. RG38]